MPQGPTDEPAALLAHLRAEAGTAPAKVKRGRKPTSSEAPPFA